MKYACDYLEGRIATGAIMTPSSLKVGYSCRILLGFLVGDKVITAQPFFVSTGVSFDYFKC